MRHDTFHTFKYKQGYIHTSYLNGIEVVKYNVDAYAYVQYAKSVHAAKIAISKHSTRVKDSTYSVSK